jgi:hypothetical protein
MFSSPLRLSPVSSEILNKFPHMGIFYLETFHSERDFEQNYDQIKKNEMCFTNSFCAILHKSLISSRVGF